MVALCLTARTFMMCRLEKYLDLLYPRYSIFLGGSLRVAHVLSPRANENSLHAYENPLPHYLHFYFELYFHFLILHFYFVLHFYFILHFHYNFRSHIVSFCLYHFQLYRLKKLYIFLIYLKYIKEKLKI